MRPAIVCVDDDWDILRSLGDQLKRRFGKNYDIELASSGEDALLLCAELAVDGKEIPLIISDQQMRGMEGDTLLIQLHSLHPKTLKIMLTGQADASSVGNVVNAAALYRYIAKPWNETDLVLTVSEALRRFEQDRQLAEHNELLKNTNLKLNSSLSLLLATLESTVDGILVLNNAGKVVSFNQKFASIWSLLDSYTTSHEDELLDLVLEQISDHDATLFKAVLAQAPTERRNFLRLKNGTIIEYYLRPQQLMGEIVGRVWSFRDLSQDSQSEAALKHQAWYDALTSLPNRILFNQRFNAALVDVANHSKQLAVMFLDLDRFKEVNDRFSHSVGDRLLQAVVQRFNGCLREADVLARWGGDEFVLLIPHLRTPEDASEVAQRLVNTVQTPFSLDGHWVEVTTSIGIAVYPDDGLDSKTLLHHADVALYEAKKCGRNVYRYYCMDGMTESPA